MATQEMNRHMFQNREAADAFFDARDADGFSSVSLIVNAAGPGTYQVSWTNEPMESLEAILGRQFKRDAAAAEAGRQADCVSRGRRAAAQEIAAVRGLNDRAAAVFVEGFCGTSAKCVNPRAEGLEPIFRAGRAAAQAPDAQRAVRIATVAQNAIVPSASAWRPGWNVFNPEQD